MPPVRRCALRIRASAATAATTKPSDEVCPIRGNRQGAPLVLGVPLLPESRSSEADGSASRIACGARLRRGMQDTPTRKEGDRPRLPQRPYLKPWYRLAQTDGRLILEYAHSATVLEGKAVEKLFPVLLPLLDGTRTIEEISDYVGEDVAPAVANALTTLADHGLLTDGPPLTGDTPAPVAETAQFLAATSVGNQTVAESEAALSKAAVAVVGAGSIAREIARLLRVAGATKLSFLDWEPAAAEIDSLDLALVVPEPAELPRLEGGIAAPSNTDSRGFRCSRSTDASPRSVRSTCLMTPAAMSATGVAEPPTCLSRKTTSGRSKRPRRPTPHHPRFSR